MVAESDTPLFGPDDGPGLAVEAKKSLRDATASLNELADWCENNFAESEKPVRVKNNVYPTVSTRTLAEAMHFYANIFYICIACTVCFFQVRLQGGDSLSGTADFALQAVNAVAANVHVLAEDFGIRMNRMADEIEKVTSEVSTILASGRLR